MPPLSLTQAKYAPVILVIQVKSTPGMFVAMPPSLIGSPVAFLPVPSPHSPGFWMLLPCPVTGATVSSGLNFWLVDAFPPPLSSLPHDANSRPPTAMRPNSDRFMASPPTAAPSAGAAGAEYQHP